MAKKPTAASVASSVKARINSISAGNAGNTSSSSSISNSGEMSTQTATSGAQGAAVNTTNIRVQGDPGFTLGQDSDTIKTYRTMMGL